METMMRERSGIAENLVWVGGWLGAVLILPSYHFGILLYIIDNS
jgi:hypothetical protein